MVTLRVRSAPGLAYSVPLTKAVPLPPLNTALETLDAYVVVTAASGARIPNSMPKTATMRGIAKVRFDKGLNFMEFAFLTSGFSFPSGNKKGQRSSR